MTTRETKWDLNERSARADASSVGAPKVGSGEAFSPQRSKPDGDENVLDYTAIERRAQVMRSEAAWAMFSAIRDWTMNLFQLGKAKAQAAAQAPLESRIQPS